ncbi:MAG TPA: chemotaxis protein CheW [Verrucomicrobiae bacterium]|nr:chemotaxis protein CheW [Verrucomicrobiae bacterium]
MNAKAESYVLFELADNIYGLPSRSVLHIDMLEHITIVPNANAAIDGVVFSRGQVIPALNLRVRFGFPRKENNLRTRIVFATIHDRTVGLIVDSAREFKSFSGDSLRPIEKTLTGINDKYLTAVTKLGDKLVLILDLEAVLKVEDVELPADAQTAASTNANS